MSVCVWTKDEWDIWWTTECNGFFELNDGTPEDNDMRFCPFCGKSLVSKLCKEVDEE